MAGQMVEFPSNGGTAQGYLATPTSGSGPGVVVIQEWWGLNDQIKGVADMFAREGYVALTPDFYHGQITTEPDEAGKMMMALNIDQTVKDARGAAQYLAKHSAVTSDKVGVIGFCMGGQLALLAGTVAPDAIGAMVDCYGVHPNVKPDFAKMQGAVLGIFGGQDGWVPPEARAQMSKDLGAAGVPHQFHVYEDASHAFMNETNQGAYRPGDAGDAWQKVLAFFREHVK